MAPLEHALSFSAHCYSYIFDRVAFLMQIYLIILALERIPVEHRDMYTRTKLCNMFHSPTDVEVYS